MRIAALTLLLTLAYPFVVYLGLARVEPRWIALVLAALALSRAYATRTRIWLAAAAATLALAAFAALANDALALKLYPMLISLLMLGGFCWTLVHPPSAIERIARMQDPNLDQTGVRYTRRVTQVWCLFFVLNGAVSLGTALWASDAAWTLYNGLISNLLIGSLFAGERVLRSRLKARFAND